MRPRNLIIPATGGVLLEADYSQLEVRVLAELSQDEVLLDDLASGRDMHRYFAGLIYGLPASMVSDAQRRTAKGMSFQLQYGATPYGIAQSFKIPVDKAEEFVVNYYNRYRGVKEFQDDLIETVRKNRTPAHPNAKSWYQSPITKRKYVFFETRNKRGEYEFRAPAIKNYIVQGTATGDIVPLALGRLMRYFLESDLTILNTVHDSVLFECEEEVAHDVARKIVKVMADAPRYVKEVWGYDWKTPLPVDVKIGPNWGDMKEIKV